MDLDKSCILIDGGKRIELLENMAGHGGITFTRDDATGDWDIVIRTKIPAMEAKDVIYKFNDLTPPSGMEAKDAFPNMPFFSAMDLSTGQPKEIPLAAGSDMLPVYDRGEFGTITFKFRIAEFGKTQNGGKTQNAAGGQEN